MGQGIKTSIPIPIPIPVVFPCPKKVRHFLGTKRLAFDLDSYICSLINRNWVNEISIIDVQFPCPKKVGHFLGTNRLAYEG